MFQPGQSGNPGGRPKDKPFREALLIELKEAGADHKKLRQLAKVLISMGERGDMGALKELFDRVDGKVPQAQIHTGDDDGGPIEHKVTRIEIVAGK